MSKSKHLSVRISGTEKAALERLARERNVPLTSLVRLAISKVLAPDPSPEESPRVAAPGASIDRREEIAWLTENSARLHHYSGQWLVLSGRNLVAHDRDYEKVLSKAYEAGVTVPFVEYVSDQDPDVAWVGL